jgi:hypothetical protein
MEEQKSNLTKMIVGENKAEEFYKNEGMAIYIKGKLAVGIHPDNLENNINALSKEDMKLNWKLLYDNAIGK